MSDNSNFPADQEQVKEHYSNGGYSAGTVGEYVRVNLPNENSITCFGPTTELAENTPDMGWVVVEINWSDASMLLAPVTALYDVERTVDTPTDRLDAEHHNAPKDGNDDPVGITEGDDE